MQLPGLAIEPDFGRGVAGGDLLGLDAVELIAQLHQIGALMTIGRRDAAARILKALDVPRYARFAMMIRGCLKSPTYLPGGKQLLWKEAA